MGWSLDLGRISGIPVRVHWSLLALIAVLAISAGSAGVVPTVAGVVLLFASVLAHELAHALTARYFGIGTRQILLLPFGGVAQISAAPRRGLHEVLIALAGPAMSLALGAAFFAAATGLEVAGAGTGVIAAGAMQLAVANAVLGVFNLLPAFPMDGGRVLRGALEERMGRRGATGIAASLGKVLAVVMGLVGLFTASWSLAFIAVFVWFAGKAELRAVQAWAPPSPGPRHYEGASRGFQSQHAVQLYRYSDGTVSIVPPAHRRRRAFQP